MARLNAAWSNFTKRGQAWDHFWQDSSTSGPILRFAVDSIGFSDGAIRIQVLNRSTSDALSMVDAASRLADYLRGVSDGLTVTEEADGAVVGGGQPYSFFVLIG